MTQEDDTIEMIRHLCPLRHDHAPTVIPPATICPHHVTAIRDMLTTITRLWDELPDLATTARTGSGGCGFNSQPPARLEVIALTDPNTAGDIPNATAILTGLANWIADRRHLNAATTATAALTLLDVHYPALTDHPHPRDAYSGLQRLTAYLRRLAGEHRHEVARCQQPHPDPQVDDECGGPIYWTGRSIGVIASCTDCGDEWSDVVVDLYRQQEALRKERESS